MKLILILLPMLFILSSCSSGRASKVLCEEGKKKECVNYSKYLMSKDNQSEEAQELTERLCRENYYDGCVVAGEIQLNKLEKEKARKYFKKACENNNPLGCTNYGFTYEGVSKKKALKFYMMACSQGGTQGCFNAGSISFDDKKYKKSASMYKKGCDLKHDDSCRQFGRVSYVYLNNFEESIKYLKKSCDRNHDGSCLYLAQIYKDKGLLTETRYYANISCELILKRQCSKKDLQTAIGSLIKPSELEKKKK